MKQPIIQPRTTLKEKFLRSEPYRSVAFVLGIIGTLLIWFGMQGQGIGAFVGVLSMLIGSVCAIMATVLSIREKDTHAIVLGIILLMWNVLFPLILMSRQI